MPAMYDKLQGEDPDIERQLHAVSRASGILLKHSVRVQFVVLVVALGLATVTGLQLQLYPDIPLFAVFCPWFLPANLALTMLDGAAFGIGMLQGWRKAAKFPNATGIYNSNTSPVTRPRSWLGFAPSIGLTMHAHVLAFYASVGWWVAVPFADDAHGPSHAWSLAVLLSVWHVTVLLVHVLVLYARLA